ncbi:MAG: phosphodiester glycosidase family protein [Treponema sp.]|nr:phosphodiester glycosidase family protein [Treponema sp.]
MLFSWFICCFVVTSCISFSPLSPETVLSPEALVPEWRPFAQDSPGLDYIEVRIREPRLQFWAIRVDLTEPALRIVVSAPVGVQAGIMPSIKVSSFVRRFECLGGINTNPFRPASAQEGEERTIVGITVSEHTLVALPYPQYDALVFYEDQRAAIVNQAALTDGSTGLEGIRNAVGGFYEVLRDGQITEAARSERGQVRYPRSAAGLSADGLTLYLLVIDGRRPGSIGATEAELAVILRQLGANDGLNFDGGGSSALALRYPDGQVRVVNTPIHGGIPGRERGVATCLGIGTQSGYQSCSAE